MKLILPILVIFFTTVSFADDTTIANPTPEITEGYFDIAAKQLTFSGPAAEAIWLQMEKVPEKQIFLGNEPSGKSKESNGTICEQSRKRPRPLAHSVLVTTCGISQKMIGN